MKITEFNYCLTIIYKIMKNLNFIITYLFLGLITMGCSNETDMLATQNNDVANLTVSSLTLKKSPAIWADCEKFSTIGTKTSFKPTAGNFDELYKSDTFKDGMGAISESKPGDKDFNGGRWHVNIIKEGIDPSKYSDACSVEDLDLDDFEPTDVYFECPLLPIKGNSGN